MTIAEMERLIAGISTAELFIERPPRQDQTIRRKLDDRSILFGLEIGLTDDLDVRLPKGAVSGVQLETYLRRLSKVRGPVRFDDLPIRYRAVATDLVTGKAVVLYEGELANAMRASMSVPGAIAPAQIGEQLLVDGGLTDNLPVDVARAMGADVVIAVNLGTPLLRRDEITSLVGVTAQMINILTEQNVRASLASLGPKDVLSPPSGASRHRISTTCPRQCRPAKRPRATPRRRWQPFRCRHRSTGNGADDASASCRPTRAPSHGSTSTRCSA
jgi:NTE family protein